MMAFVCVLIDILNRQLRIHDRAVIPCPQNYVRYAQLHEMVDRAINRYDIELTEMVNSTSIDDFSEIVLTTLYSPLNLGRVFLVFAFVNAFASRYPDQIHAVYYIMVVVCLFRMHSL